MFGDADDSEVMDVVMVHHNLHELFMMVSYSAIMMLGVSAITS